MQDEAAYHPSAPPVTPGDLGAYAPTPHSREHAGELTSDEKTMAMLIHLLAIFTGFIGPLIIWLIRKDQSAYVNAHGRAALNFIFTFILGQFALLAVIIAILFVGMLFPLAFIGLIVLYLGWFGWGIAVLVLEIMHCVQASRGEYKRYPMSIPFFKPIDPYQQ